MSKQISQLPWSAVEGDGDGEARYPTPRKVLVMSGECEFHPVADCSSNHTCRCDFEAEDNAAFIVKACNSHDQLIDGLREAKAQLMVNGDMESAIKAIYAALAAAGEGP